jgi:PleD family two-component response regulator
MDNQPKKSKILIVDDMPVNIRMLIETLKDDYATVPATSGEAALEKCQSVPLPDLILLDILMPGIDGYEVCRQLKANEETKDIPIIFITGVSESLDDAKAFSLGAADYITKPFHVATVKARVKHQITLRNAIAELQRLNKIAMDANPITGLPGNNSVRKSIQASLDERQNNFVIYADLDNFKAYNDKYGFARGDEVIHFTAELLKDSLAKMNKDSGFLGHVGGDDFVMLVAEDTVDAVVEYILTHFDKGILSFYDKEDIIAGGIIASNREGKSRRFPLMSISLGGVHLARGNYAHYLQVNDICAEVKKRAKELSGSSFFIDRRQ